jgi:hypothetical protein
LAAVSAPYFVGHYAATYGKEFPKTRDEISHEKNAIQQAAKRAGLFGIWTMEFQKRGAVHWHLLLWERIEGGQQKFVTWWHRHTCNPDEHAIVVRQGDEAKASWYFNFHQAKGDQTPPLCVGRWWGKVDSDELGKWILCEPVAEIFDDAEVIWLKRLARRMHRSRYRASVVSFLCSANRSGVDPRCAVRATFGRLPNSVDGSVVTGRGVGGGDQGVSRLGGSARKRRLVHRCRKARSSMGAQGFTWFLKEQEHMRVLQRVCDILGHHPGDPF